MEVKENEKKKVKKRSMLREKNQAEHGHRKIERKAGRIRRNVVKKVPVTYRTGKGARRLWEEKKKTDGRIISLMILALN